VRALYQIWVYNDALEHSGVPLSDWENDRGMSEELGLFWLKLYPEDIVMQLEAR
jgi:hypothetical protein